MKDLTRGGEHGPYIQSERVKTGIYKEYALKLIENGNAYYCFCPEDKTDIDIFKEECNYSGGFGYNGHCRNLSKEEVEENLKNNVPYVIRQKIPHDKNITYIVTYEDSVYGSIEVNTKNLDDQVLIKQDGYPTYNFANVVDDHLMGITDVVRGSEYISSTPKYILLYRAFNWEVPNFIHLPLINGKDLETGEISKLSKRHGAVSFEQLVNDGYLPEAIINYVVFLGWNPKTDQEIFSLEELIKVFKISGLHKSSAIFDYIKLNDINHYYISQMTDEDFYNYGLQYLNRIR